VRRPGQGTNLGFAGTIRGQLDNFGPGHC
jgi:hypothetical protein